MSVGDDVKKGDIVVADADGFGYYVRYRRGNNRYPWVKGDEFVITAIWSDHLNVRSMGTRSSVFQVKKSEVSVPSRRIGHTPPGSIGVNDERVAWLFEDAARMANRLGLCADYDRLCDALGWPGRMRTWSVKFTSEDADGEVELQLKIKARSREQALQKVKGQMPQLPSRPVIKALTS